MIADARADNCGVTIQTPLVCELIDKQNLYKAGSAIGWM